MQNIMQNKLCKNFTEGNIISAEICATSILSGRKGYTPFKYNWRRRCSPVHSEYSLLLAIYYLCQNTVILRISATN